MNNYLCVDLSKEQVDITVEALIVLMKSDPTRTSEVHNVIAALGCELPKQDLQPDSTIS